ncbi:GTP-binding protein yptV3 [Scenedesmus sp. NREL 46B-D3]|nr:GTP-binding protein yptV3 [Scenedesmus sp. NREL 46B-D3]
MAADSYDHLFKVLLVGDSAVGKSCLLMRFTADRYDEVTTSTIGVDFRVKYLDVEGKRIKLAVWDTAGQERFRTLTSSYYRGAQGIILTFTDLESIWMKEVDIYSNVEAAVKMVVANKVDLESERQVSKQQGIDFARNMGCLYVETSAKTNVAVQQAFEELVLKILETPDLVNTALGTGGVKLNQQATAQASTCSC